MPENNDVMAQIKADFDEAEEHAHENTERNDAVAVFCAFARAWFREKNVVGLGMTPSGIAFRFGDGSERLLFSNPDLDSQETRSGPATLIIGNTPAKFSKGSGLGPDTSVGITRS